jgi:hypothetical protein
MQGQISARKPDGGFVFLPVPQLCAVWCAYRHGLLHWLDVRVWCAVHELVARRCRCRFGTTPCFTQAELIPLLGHYRGIAAAVQRLTTLGFVTWRREAIGFGLPQVSATVQAEMDTMLAGMPRRRCDLPVPRRVLRFLAGGCRRSLFATVFGHLVTCLTYGQGQCRSGGYCTCAWIAATFGVSRRSIKAARRHLLAIDLLQTVATSCLVRNRLGLKIVINVHWVGPRVTASSAKNVYECDNKKTGTELEDNITTTLPEPETSHEHQCPTLVMLPTLPSPSAGVRHEAAQPGAAQLMIGQQHHTPTRGNARQKRAPSTPRDAHEPAPRMSAQKLFCEEEKNQQPAGSGSAGRLSTLVQQARNDLRAGRLPRCEEVQIEHHAATVHAQPPTAEPKPVTQPPTLHHITIQDLCDMGRLLRLYEQARKTGWIGSAEADRLTFVAVAHHVLRYRPQNPGGLFHRLVTKRLFHYVTQEDEDQALVRLKAYEREHGYGRVPGTKRIIRGSS